MFTRNITTSLTLGVLLTGTAYASDTRHLGSGIAYPGQNEAIYVNPTGLAEGGKASILGEWLFDPGSPLISAAGTYGSAGLGAAYIRPDDNNYFYGGFGVNLGHFLFGADVRATNGSGLDGDVSVAFDFGNIRLAGVARGLNGGLDRVDAGLGIKVSQATFEFDVKKPLPYNMDFWLFDAAVAVAVQEFSFSFGYDFGHGRGGTYDGSIHAGVDFTFSQNLSVQLSYRPTPQELPAYTKWAAGLRYSF